MGCFAIKILDNFSVTTEHICHLLINEFEPHFFTLMLSRNGGIVRLFLLLANKLPEIKSGARTPR